MLMSNTSQRALPSSLARYMAASASRSSSSGSAVLALIERTPKDAVTKRWPPSSSTRAPSGLARRAHRGGGAVAHAARGLLAAGAADHHGELVAAEAGDQIARSQHAPQP